MKTIENGRFPEQLETTTKKARAPIVETVGDVIQVVRGVSKFAVIGTSPLIINRMSQKVNQELLLPRGKKGAVEKATTLKHKPVEEFRNSVYVSNDMNAPLLMLKSTSFKGAISTAALDMPGVKKAQIERLVHVDGDYVSIYGVPMLHMSVVRCADFNKTPDVRTRAIVPVWAALVSITYVKPLISAQAVLNLMGAAGITVGVGDWRPEKGGNHGQFAVASVEDLTFAEIAANGGREAQQDALDHPVCYDDETTSLLSWYDEEIARRVADGKVAS